MNGRFADSMCWAFALMAALAVVPCGAQAQSAPSDLLNALFQERAVLQRGVPLPVWGQASPGDTVKVEMAGKRAATQAGADGRWAVTLPALPEGGPHTLAVRVGGRVAQTVRDVLVGDVFLCSGQSNMELPVSRTLNAPAEVRSAGNERIRMFTVTRASSAAPRDTLTRPGGWEVASPETVGDWSAACYYFARTLHEHIDVPLGLVNSSWGGSSISAWMSAEALSGAGDYEEPLALLSEYARDEQAAQRTFGQEWEAWWREATGDAEGAEPWQPAAGAAWKEAPEGLGDWKTWDDPGLQSFLGMLWLRATVELTAEQAAQEATLMLGSVDEVDQTWMNGAVVGNTFGWGTPRTYTVPAEQLQPGENVVVVNVLNNYGEGGLTGEAEGRALVVGGERIPLEDWRYQKAPSALGSPPRAPWESVSGLSTIHNAMVAPLHDYRFKAVLWYQGESDTGRAEAYLGMLEALKAQWRAQFGAELPVLVVQLANYGAPPTAPQASGWAQVREAQRQATQRDPHAGLAVAVDVGSAHDIHPADKQAVGRRLARAARAVVYDEDVTPSGPQPVRAARSDSAVAVTFDDVAGALVVYGDDTPVGFELCGEEQQSCRYAEAQVSGEQVLLRGEQVQAATRVRYCWADSPICTLYDDAGLPATPFELPISD